MRSSLTFELMFGLVYGVNATFNNISVLLVEETGVPRENYRPATSH
jgi:hypothetical protein